MSAALNVTHLPSVKPPPVVESEKPCEVIGIDGVVYRPHVNGGGLVAETATVADSVYVGPTAVVRGRAWVAGKCELLGRSVVEDDAVVLGRCTLRHRARVSGNAILLGQIALTNDARIGGDAFIRGVHLFEYFVEIGSGCRIFGNLRVS